MEENIHCRYVELLKKELIPALGCTEPIALAYAAAKATEVLGKEPEHIVITVSGNVIKNVKGVVVPNSGGQKGIAAAATLGAIAGDAKAELRVLEGITNEDIKRSKKLVSEGFCKCKLKENVDNLFITARAEEGNNYSEVTIINRHTLIVEIVKNGEILFSQELDINAKEEESTVSLKSIYDFINEVDVEEIREPIENQIKCNTAIAKEGLNNPYGSQVGRTILEVYGNGIEARAKAMAAAGSDARMSGCSMPVVINSGSGNQGMTLSLPIIEYAKEINVSEDKLIRALALGNLASFHQKKYIGRLSAFCGVVSAAAGAGAGIAYLYDLNLKSISNIIADTVADVGGIVCDGAKASCAAKIASAVDAAILSVNMEKRNRSFCAGDGIIGNDIEKTIRNVGQIGRIGMKSTDVEILNIMIENN
ncbi:MAG: serine dehydratase subunit alpha family protein [Peptostreptococcaceae bacterium]|nr:serine dehydratase subunit alpha family protein [Peptostreptococcaceae bacterium]